MTSKISEFVVGNIVFGSELIAYVLLQIEDKASIIPLVAGMRKEVQMLVAEVNS
jgi:hypothetical protein